MAIVDRPNLDSLVIAGSGSGDFRETVKAWLEAGIPPLTPGPTFRRLFPMGTTFFYDEIKNGRLHAVKHAGRACVEIEEAVRYKSELPKMAAAAA
jgi:hypothetical protein